MIILVQAEDIQHLEDEISRLKNQKPKAKITPSRLEKGRKKGNKASSGKRSGSKQITLDV